MEFNPEQLIILSVIASAMTMALRFIVELLTRAKVRLPQWAMLFLVYLVSVVIAWLWFPQVFPAWPVFVGNPATDVPLFTDFLMGTATAISAVLGFAKFTYDWLIIKIKMPLASRLMPKLYG